MTTAQAHALELIGKNGLGGGPLDHAKLRATSVIERKIADSSGNNRQYFEEVKTAIEWVSIVWVTKINSPK